MLADASTDADRPDVEELYQSANNTSNLKVEAERRGAGDILIAAGWSASRVGMQLLRLHSEWDASEKPPKPTKESIRALVGTFQRALPGEDERPKGEKQKRLTTVEAQHYAAAWYAHEIAMLLGKLKTFPAAREQAALQALKWRMGESQDPVTRSDLAEERKNDEAMLVRHRALVDAAPDADAKGAAEAALKHWERDVAQRRQKEQQDEYHRATAKAAVIVRFWLDQTCRTCGGLRWQMVPGSPSLSNRPCPACAGKGVAEVPHQEQGKRLANWLDSCVEDARGTVKINLANWRQARNEQLRDRLQREPRSLKRR
jgi:hypothetical protein